ARGEESPYADWLSKWDPETPDRPMTTRIDVGDFLDQRRAALLAHRTQVDPEGFWMRLPEEIVREVFPWEEYLLARTLVDDATPDGGYEDDLFSGLRSGASVRRAAG
ncbi:MAG: mycothiol S-conjugate amidase, partial [Actinomycetota bacterium]|nr:mycothiol S-conjugate amidase [Actinomycetota bacterium]